LYCGTAEADTSWPTTQAMATKASHPATAVFWCRALQQAIRCTMGARLPAGDRSGTGALEAGVVVGSWRNGRSLAQGFYVSTSQQRAGFQGQRAGNGA